MQATSTSALEPVTSDQSLAQSPMKAEMKIMQENSMESDPASDQKTTWDSMASDQPLAGSHAFRTQKVKNTIKRTIDLSSDHIKPIQ